MQFRNDVKDSKTTKEEGEARQYLISDANFQLLKQCQKDVYDATETSPSIRKIINAIINEENINKVKTRFIDIWSN
jgi:hypothetical protein